ncbi:hypothetical protein SAMN05421678_107278 [Actinopolymorpha cephalotaxi]|uniref:Uncharacterized protein n=1 Tax=Actinopolymorpha cephalotaxi TaxID=504797 RepID=A0A1I2TPI4_9ACTN|nr:hypothetical protein [Actinopolymorpha cephalotaxi]SFG66804.1 hypothetical protein SAMN05421678_107278 [Actinopolymorpha cephalotaxi]
MVPIPSCEVHPVMCCGLDSASPAEFRKPGKPGRPIRSGPFVHDGIAQESRRLEPPMCSMADKPKPDQPFAAVTCPGPAS